MTPGDKVVCASTPHIEFMFHTQFVQLFVQTLVTCHETSLIGASANKEVVDSVVHVWLIDNWCFRQFDGSREDSHGTEPTYCVIRPPIERPLRALACLSLMTL